MAPQSDSLPPDVRAWLVAAHAQLAPLLPRGPDAPPQLTDDLVDSAGQPTDVFRHFNRDPARLHTLLGNLTGITHSAQAAGADSSDDWKVPPWPEFEDVWIPVADGLENFARFGRAEQDGKTANANCIFVLPGIFGDLTVWRTRDVAIALRDAGYHVIAIEPRGMGRTHQRYPDVPCNFGVTESGDLVAAAQWAQSLPYVDRTGLVGFCWGANHALTTAWTANRDAGHIGLDPRLHEHVQATYGPRVFEAGYIAFSPVLRFEEIVDQCRAPTSVFANPVINSLQSTVGNRMRQQGYPGISGDLARCIEFEFRRTRPFYPQLSKDAYRYLRLLPYRGMTGGDKLECVRSPVLIVQGANDPLTSAQNVADLIAQTDNPNVAAIVLPGGGHVGFAPYARDYFYSLMINFFDSQTGAAAISTAKTTSRPANFPDAANE
jgi:predicted alpha/beta-fold hydrolase